jgi:hypothetical protein
MRVDLRAGPFSQRRSASDMVGMCVCQQNMAHIIGISAD